MEVYFKNGLSEQSRMQGFCFYVTPVVCIQRCDLIAGNSKFEERKTGKYSLHFAFSWLFWSICFSWYLGRYGKYRRGNP